MPRDTKILIYSSSLKKPEEILDHVKERFGLEIHQDNLIFVKMTKGEGVKGELYKSFTLLWQSYASIVACCEAL